MTRNDRSQSLVPSGDSETPPLDELTRKLASAVHAGVFLALAGSLLGYAGSFDFLLDLFAHFRLVYALALAAGFLVALAQRNRKLAAAWGLGFCANFAAIAPLWLTPAQYDTKAMAPPIRVLAINVLRDNPEKKAVVDAIRQADPDLFVAVELDRAWLDRLSQDLSDRWPHAIQEERGDAFGIALFSKRPMDNGEVFESPGSYVPSVRATVTFEGTRLIIYATHPFPPVTRFNQENWVVHMDDMARRIKAETGPVVVLGDFNTTPWSENYRRFRNDAGLADTMQGFGPQASWPTFFPVFGLPIDHVLIRPGIRTIKRRVGPFVGSDHYPVTVDLEIPR